MRKIYFRPLLISVSIMVISAIAYKVLSGKTAPQIQATYPPAKVALATVTQTPFAEQVSAVGELEAKQQVQIASEVSGRIAHIAFTSGQVVKAGQLLVQLNDAPEQAQRLRLQAQHNNAESVYQRLSKLVAVNAATQEQLDQALAARDMALGELRHIDAIITQKSIRAPFTGVIGIRRVHAGQFLNVAEPVASLVNAQTLFANFALAEQHSPDLSVGQAVNLDIDAYPGQVFKGNISAIDPYISSSRTLLIQATLDNSNGALKAGMFANIALAKTTTSDVLTIPETAITYTAYGDTVFVVQHQKNNAMTVKRIAVKTGLRQDGMVEVREGLQKNDQVVTSGQLKLSDGMLVERVAEDTLQTVKIPS